MKLQTLAWPLALLLALPAHSQNLPKPARRDAATPQPPAVKHPTVKNPAVQQPAPQMAGEADEIKSIFNGDKYPLTLKLKDIDTGWRRMNIGGELETPVARPTSSAEMFEGENFAATLISLFAGEPDVYLTKGTTVKEGGDSFLVAYRVRLDRQAVKTFEDSFPKGEQLPSPAQVTRMIEMFVQERPLDLSLLNLRMVGRVTDIRPFRFQDQMAILNTRFKSEFTKAINTSSLSNLRQLGAALREYIADKDQNLPPLQNAEATRKALMPYAKSESLFMHPGQSKQLYLTNPVLSGKKLAHFAGYEPMLVVFYEPTPAADGTRGVLFLNGRAKRIKETEWPQLKKVSKIS